MKKRALILVAVGLLALSVNAFALKGTSDFGIGAEVTSINFGSVGSMLTFHIPRVPLYFSVGADFADEPMIAATVDYWFVNRPIGRSMSYYVGLGGYVGLATAASDVTLAAGPRLPLGAQLWLLENDLLEVFLEVAPAWVLFTGSEIDPRNAHVQVALGFRIWP